MRRFGKFLGGVVTTLSLGSLACAPQDVPGESEGSHLFQGALMDNTCGASAVPAEALIEMRVELRRDGALGVWRRTDAPLMIGSVETDGDWRFSFSSTVGVYDFDPITGRGPCSLEQIETIRLSPMQPSEDETEEDVEGRFVGTSVVQFVPTVGTDCGLSLAVLGGPFYDLPCTVEYELSSDPIEPLFPEPDDDI